MGGPWIQLHIEIKEMKDCAYHPIVYKGGRCLWEYLFFVVKILPTEMYFIGKWI